MRICLIQDLLPFHCTGGAPFLGWRTACGLHRRGHDVTVVTTSKDSYQGEQTIDDVRVVFLKSVTPWCDDFHHAFTRAAFDRYVRSHQTEFDIVQVRGWRTAGLAGISCREEPLRVPIIGHTSGLGFVYEFETRPRVLWEETTGTPVRKLKRVLARRFYYLRDTFPMERAVRHLDGFSTVTTRGLRLAHRLYGIPWKQLHLINDGIPAVRFHSPERDPTGQHVLYAGALVKRKGVDLLIRSMRHVLDAAPDARLRIVGDGPERLTLEHLVDGLRITDAVTFVGAIENDRMPNEMATCTIFANPSISTVGYETVQIEAMLSGRLLVAPRTASNRMLMTNGREGLFYSPGSMRSLTQTLLRGLTLDPSERMQMGARARTRALREFTVERMSAMSEAVFQKVVDQFSASGSHSR